MLKGAISLLTGHKIRYRGPRDHNQLFLTFDDGPHPTHTPALLNVLDAHGIHAVFFVVGREATTHSEVLRCVLEKGHTLGNHSVSHPRMDLISDAGRHIEFDGMNRFLQELDGKPTHFIRPPYGGLSLSFLAHLMQSEHRTLMWSRDSLDYKYSASQIVDHFKKLPPNDGDIILFHDDGGAAAESLATLIPIWLSSGYSFGSPTSLA